ncbi:MULTISPECIES: hypothetical protein [Streptomyces]|uniref:hypothetical protein n=1 Tax=Streptomyces TaxID=1883 RepID=UPI0033AAC43E
MPNAKGRRRRFGSVRKLPSGRFQARYRGPDGLMRTADKTFATQTDADRWLVKQEAKILDGDWQNPDVKVTLGDFADAWIKDRDYAATTRERNNGVLEPAHPADVPRGPAAGDHHSAGMALAYRSPRLWGRRGYRRQGLSGPPRHHEHGRG